MAVTEILTDRDGTVLPCRLNEHKGTRRIGHYLWTNGQLRVWRTPFQCWAIHSKDYLLAVVTDDGIGVKRTLIETPLQFKHLLTWVPRTCTPVSVLDLLNWEKQAAGVGHTLMLWDSREIVRLFGDVPVSPEDGYASGNCRTETATWLSTGFPGRDSVTVREALEDRRHHSDARRAACWAIAFVWGRRPMIELKNGLAPGQLENALTRGWKCR